MRTFLKLGAIALIGIMLAGCELEEREKNPVVSAIGNFNGCDVSYVDRGYRYNSFYIATCEGSVVTTGQTGNKNNTPMVNVQNISGLTQEEKDMIAKNRDAVLKSAMSKLTQEEKNVLGLK